jgi:hypothetical protein
MAGNRRTGVGEFFYGFHKFIAVLRVSCVEVRGRRMTQITFSDEICQNDQPMTKPSPASQRRQCADRRYMITRMEVVEQAPTRQSK